MTQTLQERSLKSVPEFQLTKLYQQMINMKVQSSYLLYARGVSETTVMYDHQKKLDEAIKPIKQELDRRSALVLK